MKNLTRLVLGLILSFSLTLKAESQSYTIDTWTGTAYIGNGWFSYEIKDINKTDGAIKLSNTIAFLLSPQYTSPIRTIALKVKCSKASPSRQLTISPFIDNAENKERNILISSLEADNEYEIVKVTFNPSENVTAFRLSLSNVTSPSTGEWTISQIFVFYSTPEENEESIIPTIVNPVKTPANLHIVDFSATSLSIAADTVEKAIGYKFSLTPYDVANIFEYIEAFTSTPQMSATSGWTRNPADSSSFDTYTGGTTTDGDSKALKVEGVDVEFISPISKGNISEYSFMYRNGTSATDGLSNTIAVYGRTSSDSNWEVLLPEFAFVENTSKHYITNTIDSALNIKQIKIVHKAGSNPSKTISFDTLRIASEGEKTASDPIIVESNTPSYNFTNLETKWYDIKVQAIADTSNTHYIDSEWSESDSIDLHWANLEILPPSGLTISSAGEKLTISWDPVANAEHYSVDVFVPGYPPIYVTQNVETVSTKITIVVPELGEYAASVTAYGPFGKVKGNMSTLTTEVKMGKVENLAIKEISPESFTATWSQVAFAEGYEVKVLELSGNATIFNTDYSSMPEVLKDNANNTWEMAQYFYDGSGTFNSSRITFQHPTTWIASCEYQEEVTKVEYSFYYGGTPTDDFGEDTFLLEGLINGTWEKIEENIVTPTKQSFSTVIPKSKGIKKVRFTLNSTGSPFASRNIAFGKVNVTCGEITENEVRSTKTSATTYSADSLTSDGRFKLIVSPLPSNDDSLSATIALIDLSTAHPTDLMAIEMRSLNDGIYTQDFSALSAITKESPITTFSLPYWQMIRSGDTIEKIKFSKLGGNPSASGIYACCDDALEGNSYALGSLASTSIETMYGLAFLNDYETAVKDFSISFKSMQRTFKNDVKSLALEYLITNEVVSIASKGAWRSIEIPVTSPFTTQTREDRAFYEQEISAFLSDINIPVNGVLLLRWRDIPSPNNPLTCIDDLVIKYTFKPLPTSIILK
jgi:hypothetical protein